MKFKFLLFVLLSLLACRGKGINSKTSNVQKSILAFDSLMRNPNINESKTAELIETIDINLDSVDSVINKGNPNWIVRARVKYNSDSTVVLVKTREKWMQGFQRQIILYAGDSLLYLQKFSVQTEEYDSSGYQLLETIDYLTTTKNIQRKLRVEFPPKRVSDTLSLRKLPYENYEETPPLSGPLFTSELKDIRYLLWHHY